MTKKTRVQELEEKLIEFQRELGNALEAKGLAGMAKKQLEEQVEELKGEVEILTAELQNVNEIRSDIAVSLQQRNVELTQAELQVQEKQEKIDDLETELDTATEQANSLMRNRADQQDALKDAGRKITRLNKDKATKDQTIEELKHTIKVLESRDGAKELNAAIELAESRKWEIDTVRKSLEAERTDHKATKEEHLVAECKIEELEAEVKSLEGQLSRAKKKKQAKPTPVDVIFVGGIWDGLMIRKMVEPTVNGRKQMTVENATEGAVYKPAYVIDEETVVWSCLANEGELYQHIFTSWKPVGYPENLRPC